jgi:hypothetical protein
LDLFVRTLRENSGPFAEGDWFLREVVEKGRCFMRKAAARWAHKAEGDLRVARALRKVEPTLHYQICFQCQQPAEKYLCGAPLALDQYAS